jgi:hypothetical protein
MVSTGTTMAPGYRRYQRLKGYVGRRPSAGKVSPDRYELGRKIRREAEKEAHLVELLDRAADKEPR